MKKNRPLDMTQYRVLARWYYVRLLDSELKSPGGIILPERVADNYCHGEVLGAGEGNLHHVPDYGPVQTGQQAKVGDCVLFPKHHFHPWTQDAKEGWILDQQLAAVQPDGTSDIIPANDLVLIQQDGAARYTDGGILLPETHQFRPDHGTVLEIGPGWCDEFSHDFPGLRRPVTLSLGLPLDYELRGKRVHWLPNTDLFEVKDEMIGLDYVLVAARDLFALED